MLLARKRDTYVHQHSGGDWNRPWQLELTIDRTHRIQTNDPLENLYAERLNDALESKSDCQVLLRRRVMPLT